MVKWLPPNGFTGKVHHIKAPRACAARSTATA
jgi:hypothetical protein